MSKTGRATYITKRTAKNLYEQDGESFTAIGNEIEYGGPTVSKWAKEEGWIKAGTEPTAIHDDDDKRIFAGVIADYDPPEPSGDLQDLKAEIALLEAKNAELDKEVERLKPTVDVADYVADRVKWLEDNSPEGDKFWINRAERKFAKDNKVRAKEGLVPFNIKEFPDMLDDLIVELKTREAMRQEGEPDEKPYRKVKMLIWRNGVPTIEPIPLENQINNMKGSLADGIVRYTRKGFKLTDPFLCPRGGCYKAAGVDEAGRWLYDGYCKDLHRQEVEGDQASVTAGLNVRDVVSGG